MANFSGLRKRELLFYDFAAQAVLVFIKEWKLQKGEAVEGDSQRPHINQILVRHLKLGIQALWCQKELGPIVHARNI